MCPGALEGAGALDGDVFSSHLEENLLGGNVDVGKNATLFESIKHFDNILLKVAAILLQAKHEPFDAGAELFVRDIRENFFEIFYLDVSIAGVAQAAGKAFDLFLPFSEFFFAEAVIKHPNSGAKTTGCNPGLMNGFDVLGGAGSLDMIEKIIKLFANEVRG